MWRDRWLALGIVGTALTCLPVSRQSSHWGSDPSVSVPGRGAPILWCSPCCLASSASWCTDCGPCERVDGERGQGGDGTTIRLAASSPSLAYLGLDGLRPSRGSGPRLIPSSSPLA